MFVHLRLHTEFSVVDGTNRIDDVVAAAAADGQPALGISDLNNLFGRVVTSNETMLVQDGMQHGVQQIWPEGVPPLRNFWASPSGLITKSWA